MRREPFALLALALLVTGCSTVRPAVLAGRWMGTWSGYGLADVPRHEPVTLDLQQSGEIGSGRLVMIGTGGAESVPLSIRDAGMTGARVVFTVSGSELRLEHELGPQFFAAEAVVSGDRMRGRILYTRPEVRFELVREAPRAISVPAPAPPPPPLEPPRPSSR